MGKFNQAEMGEKIFQAGHSNKAPEVATAPCLQDSQEQGQEAGGGTVRGRLLFS